MKNFTENCKKYYPVFVLILCALICASRFAQNFILPLDDEAFYATGDIANVFSWAPAYKLYYIILNSFTHDSFISVYYNFFFISIVLIPFATYFTLRNLNFNIESSAYAAILTLLAEWNQSYINTRVQTFNYLFLLFIFNLRWHLLRKKTSSSEYWPHITFYLLLFASLYIRQDNILLIGACFSWDLYHSKFKKKWAIALLALISFYLIKNCFMNDLFGNVRQIEAFTDHIWTGNPELFSPGSFPKQMILNEYFHYPKSIWDIAIGFPKVFFHHVLKNIMNFFHLIFLKSISVSIQQAWRNPHVVRAILFIISLRFFSNGIDDSSEKKINYKELQLFSLGLIAKCLGVTILLSWWLKYYFELSIVIMIWSIVLLTKFIPKKYSTKSWVLNYSLVIVPYLIFNFYSFIPAYDSEMALDKLVHLIRQEHEVLPIKKILSGSRFYSWPLIEIQPYDLYVQTTNNLEAKKDFNLFLQTNHIDTIVLYDKYRARLTESGLGIHIKNFEENYSKYGYEIKYRNQKNHIIYRINKETYTHWN